MERITELIRARKSIRTFDGRALNTEDLEALRLFAERIENPYGIPMEFRFLNAREHGLICPVVSGTDLYVGGKIEQTSHAEEAFGYAFEMLLLYAQSLGIGAVWLGGTMNRSAFEAAMQIGDGEMMPCAAPLGYPATKLSLRETIMRKAIKADERLPFERVFLDGTFDVPLSAEKAGRFAHALEMVRLAPSAVNKQPWRVVVIGNDAHFYLRRSKGFGNGSALDMQKIDLGIALCHFELAVKEEGREVSFFLQDPCIFTDAEYMASYRIGG